jgi:hypothetical protein
MRRLPKKQTVAGLVGGHENRDWPRLAGTAGSTDRYGCRGHRPRQAPHFRTCPAGERRMAGWQWRELDAIGLGWTSRDLIQQVRRADQAHSETTDATRTAGGFHLA